MQQDYSTIDSVNRVEQESRRLSRKILKIEKRLSLFDKHETEKHLSEQLEIAKDIKNKFSLLYTKFTVLESIRYYLQHDHRLLSCTANIIKAFDEDKKFWVGLEDQTLEDLAEFFYVCYKK